MLCAELMVSCSLLIAAKELFDCQVTSVGLVSWARLRLFYSFSLLLLLFSSIIDCSILLPLEGKRSLLSWQNLLLNSLFLIPGKMFVYIVIVINSSKERGDEK